MTSISLRQAREIADRTLEHGQAMGLQPLAVAVLDPRGCVKVLQCADGTSLMRPDMATAKAWGVLGLGRSTRSLSTRAKESPQFFAALASLTGGRILPVPGGLPILGADGTLLGAIGVSGDTSDADEECAVAAIAASGLRHEESQS